MDIGGMGDRRHIPRPVPCRPHSELLREYLQLPRGRYPADLAYMHPDEIYKALGDEGPPLRRIVEKLAYGDRSRGAFPDPPEPSKLLQRYGVLKEEQVIRIQLRGKLDSLCRRYPLMDIMDQLYLIAKPCPDAFEEPYRIPDVLLAVEVYAGPRSIGCSRRGDPIALAAIASALAADRTYAHLLEAPYVVAKLLDIPSVGMAIHGNRLPDLPAKKLVEGHPCHLSLDIPEGHIDSRYRVVLDGAVAPVAILMHELP